MSHNRVRTHKHHKEVEHSDSESSSSCSSSSDSESECSSLSKDRKTDSESCSSEKSDHKKCEKKFDICDIYDYFRNRLLEDEQLMVAGSDAYLYASNNISQTIPTNHAITFNTNVLNYNIETVKIDSPFFIRDDGVFILFFVATVDSACQFTIFINGIIKELSCVGTNSGAGQVVSRHLMKLKKNDNVVIRSYISTANSFKSNLFSGGSDPGNDLTFLMMKISSLDHPVKEEDEECLPKHKLRLFKHLTEKLLSDKELMVKGFNICGTFSNVNTQSVLTDASVVFNTQNNVSGLLWSSSVNPDQVKIVEDGVYKLFFMVNTPTPAQFTFAVNGVLVATTTQGSSKGAGQITIRTLLELKKNDVVTVNNHLSSNGSVTINSGAGGSQASIATILTIFKIAPLVKPVIKTVDCDLVEKFKCYYKQFKQFLLCKEYLQLAGSPSYMSLVSSALQEVAINDAFYWPTTVESYNITHVQGRETVIIEKSGVYDLFVDICTDEPIQYTLFVNGTPDPLTIFGRDSGANRCLSRQFVKLNKGDVVQVKNYTSYANNVHTAINAGGNYIGQNSLFMAFLLHPVYEKC